jgi:cytidylate kinase
MNPFIVAIDGGAASGKSSTARALSKRFNLLHVDTGSFYRAISAELLRRKLTPADLPAIIAVLPAIRLGTRVNGRTAHMEIDGHPIVAAEIRSPEVNETVAKFAPIPELRAALLGYQRDQAGVARAHDFRGLVMEGRDIGSKIFPNADLRFFLHADLEERARRRANEGLRDKIAERDILDNKRLLESAKGAIMIDSTNLTLEQVVEKISVIVAEKLK